MPQLSLFSLKLFLLPLSVPLELDGRLEQGGPLLTSIAALHGIQDSLVLGAGIDTVVWVDDTAVAYCFDVNIQQNKITCRCTRKKYFVRTSKSTDFKFQV